MSKSATMKPPKIDIKKNLSFIWYYLKNYKIQTIIIFSTTFITTSILSAAIFGQLYFTDYITKHIMTSTIDTNIILLYTLLIIGGYVLFLMISIIQVFIMTKLAQKIGKQIRNDLFTKILELKLSYFDSQPSGDIMSKLTNDVNNITNALTQNVTQFLTNFFQIILMLISMFIFSPYLALIILGIAPFQFSFIFFILKKAQPNFLKKQVYIGELNGFVEETISGQKVINNF
ncbi:MAG: ABC transporter transmembrane domain-containing protein, partial [Metamycoplasmataceae bacterium]